MAGDSTTVGFLAPAATNVDDKELEYLFQAMLVAILGIEGALVRRAFQTDATPTAPGPGTAWCAFTIDMLDETNSKGQWEHDPNGASGQGQDDLTVYEIIDVRVSMYGPTSQGMASLVRDGLKVAQNRDVLRSNGLAYQYQSKPQPMHQLTGDTNMKTQRRYDVTLRFMRQIVRVYPVRSITAVDGSLSRSLPGADAPETVPLAAPILGV